MRDLFGVILVLTSGAVAAAAQGPPGDDFERETRAWHEGRIERLKSESGWLTLVGLHWLEEGENRFGSSPDNPIALPEGRAPAHAGTFVLEKGRVRVIAEPSAGLTLGDAPVTARELRTDADGTPDVLKLGDLSLVVIKRGEKHAIRVRDPQSPVRTGFRGIETFPPSRRFRVVADWEPYPEPRNVEIPTVLGTVETQTAPGLARFSIDGVPCALEPVVEGPEEAPLFFIFKDATSGKETYAPGRFLYADPPKDGKVVLDFNRAYNPPCAFTPYATCPLPPKRNRLAVAIEAGEKTFGKH